MFKFLANLLDGDKNIDKNKARICIDFDGTIIEKCIYPETNYILKPYIKETLDYINKNYNVEFLLYTARTGWYRKPAIKCIKDNNLPITCIDKNCKPRAKYYIDDSDIYCDKIDWKGLKTILENKLKEYKK